MGPFKLLCNSVSASWRTLRCSAFTVLWHVIVLFGCKGLLGLSKRNASRLNSPPPHKQFFSQLLQQSCRQLSFPQLHTLQTRPCVCKCLSYKMFRLPYHSVRIDCRYKRSQCVQVFHYDLPVLPSDKARQDKTFIIVTLQVQLSGTQLARKR